MDIAPPNLTSSTCEIVPMRAVSWHSCLRKASWKSGVVTGIYRPPGIAERQGPCCTTSDRKPRQEHSGDRYSPLERPGKQRNGSTPDAATRVQGPPAATRVHPDIQREETSSGYPDVSCILHLLNKSV